MIELMVIIILGSLASSVVIKIKRNVQEILF